MVRSFFLENLEFLAKTRYAGFMKIQTKRAYEAPAPADGARYLVDRLWPRGLKREDLKIVDWFKDAAPSNALRKRFHHDPALWEVFRREYYQELDRNPAAWQPLLEAARHGTVTLVYSAKDTQHNQAVALMEYLETKAS